MDMWSVILKSNKLGLCIDREVVITKGHEEKR